MRPEVLLDVIGEADDDYILDARQAVKNGKRHRMIRPLLIAAIVAGLLSVGVAAEIDRGAVSNLLAPLFGGTRTELQGTVGVPLDAADSEDGYTLTVDAMMGDDYAFAVVYTFSRDDGQPIPEKATFRDWDSKRYFDGSSFSQMHGFPDEENPHQMHFVESWIGSDSLVNRITTTKFSGLYVPGEDGEEDTLLAEGPWKVRFNLLYENASIQLPVEDLTVSDAAGDEYVLQTAVLSPVGLHMDLLAPIPSPEEKRIYGPDGNGPMDRFTVSLLLKDGSVVELLGSAGAAWNDKKDQAAVAHFDAIFGAPIFLEEMDALIICDTTLPVAITK